MSDKDGAEKPRHSKRLRAMVAAALAAPIAIALTGDGQAGIRPQGGNPVGSNEAAAEKGLFRKVAQRIARRDALLASDKSASETEPAAPASASAKLHAAVSLLGVSLGVSAGPTLDGAGPAAAAKSAVATEKLAQSSQLEFVKSLQSGQVKYDKSRPHKSRKTRTRKNLFLYKRRP